MLRRRVRASSAPSDLPPTRRLGWATTVLLAAVALFGWLRFTPEVFIGPAVQDAPLATLRGLIVFAVPLALGAVLVYAIWRFQLEWLAHRPGPILVLPFVVSAGRGDGASGADPDASQAIALTSLFQRYVVRSRLYGPTAIPPSGRSTDFLTVVERAGDTGGVWGALGRLPRLLAPPSAYQVECTILPPSAPDPGETADGGPAMIVELTRFPGSLVAPVVIRDATWERVVERAAHWVAGVILPRTRRCRFPPWTMWRGLRLPDELFDLYQRFESHKQARELDEAMAALRAALKLDPGNLALRLEMGKLQEQLGLRLDALATYEDIIGRASRGDRALALLWNVPPAEWGHADADESEDRAWSDRRRIAELPARHPVVYVARYRHMLLLGLGDRLAAEWWPTLVDDDQQRIAGTSVVDRCRTGVHRSAHQRRSDYSRRILAQRLGARYPWVEDELRNRCLLSSPSWEFMQPIGPGSTAVPAQDAMAADLRIFLTTTSLCELELLLLERGRDLLTSRDVREVVSLRSLRLVLPWGILRAGLAITSAPPRGVRQPAHPSKADESIVFRLSRPRIMPKHGAGLLDRGSGWPPDLDVLRRYIATTLRSRTRTLHSWHEHYNAACTYALVMLPPGPGELGGRPSTLPPQLVARASEAAVSQLSKAVACGDSGFLASQREWLLTEDPDLDILRGTDMFFDLEAATFGSVRGTDRRGPQLVTWQISTFSSRLVLVIAQQMSTLWRERQSRTRAVPDKIVEWAALEDRVWRIVDELCWDHRDSGARHDAVESLRAACPGALTIPDLAVHPRFSPAVLARQFSSLRGPQPDWPPQPPIEKQVATVIANATLRFGGVVRALRAGSEECCSRERDLLPSADAIRISRMLDSLASDWTEDLDAEEKTKSWVRRSYCRWRALEELFDDDGTHERSMSQRWEALRDHVHEGI
jgi:hypothetical protein